MVNHVFSLCMRRTKTSVLTLPRAPSASTYLLCHAYLAKLVAAAPVPLEPSAVRPWLISHAEGAVKADLGTYIHTNVGTPHRTQRQTRPLMKMFFLFGLERRVMPLQSHSILGCHRRASHTYIALSPTFEWKYLFSYLETKRVECSNAPPPKFSSAAAAAVDVGTRGETIAKPPQRATTKQQVTRDSGTRRVIGYCCTTPPR